MFKFAKITLLTLAAFLVLGFSITANAAKPPTQQVISTAPINGGSFWCTAVNLTDQPLSVTWNFTTHLGAVITRTYPNMPAGNSFSQDGGINSLDNIYCTVRWVGQPSDVRASMCAYKSITHTEGIGCFELY